MHALPNKRKWIWVGRRGGKGRGVLFEALGAINEASITPSLVTKEIAAELGLIEGADITNTLTPQIHVWTVAPNYGQAQQVWNEMKEVVPASMVRTNSGKRGNRSQTGWNEDRMSVRLDLPALDERGRRRVRREVFWEIKSADNFEMLQTVGLDFLWVTESQDIKEGAWDKVRPVLSSPGRLGRACIEGIPPVSKAHWFSRNFHYAKNNPGPNDIAIQATTFENVYLTPDQQEDVRNERERTTEAHWNRMYMAEQPEGGGGFFRKIDEAARGLQRLDPIPGRPYVAGLDLGKQVDPTVLIIKDRETRESVHYVEMLKRDWVLQKETIMAECKRWSVQNVHIDSTGMGGDVIYDELADQGLPIQAFKFTSASKHQLFLNYAVALERETVSFPSDWGKLRNQLEGMEVGNSGAQYVFKQTDGGHDDWVDAECLALSICDPPAEDFERYAGMIRSQPSLPPLNADAASSRRNNIMSDLKRRRTEAKIEAWAQEHPDLFVNGKPVHLG